MLEPIEVMALDQDMNRASGGIAYRSLIWRRRYYECGTFELYVPKTIYKTSWKYIYTNDRPEMGIIEKVVATDDVHAWGGKDTVKVSGRFAESLLSRKVILPSRVTGYGSTGDNVAVSMRWAEEIFGDRFACIAPDFAGVERAMAPEAGPYGSILYDELKLAEASFRVLYDFVGNSWTLQPWRGLDRTQSQGGGIVPDPEPPEPDEPTIDDLYEAVDYIQSDGGAYIDTGFKQNQDTRIVMHAKQTTSPSAFTWAFEGRDSNTSGANGVLWFYSEGVWKSDHAGNADRLDLSGVGVNDDLYIDKNKNVCTVNGVTVKHTAKTYQSNTNLVLMACNTSGEISGYMAGRLYYTQIYDNGTLVRNLMPYRRKADGVFGMLDLVNEVFYESASGVPFTGPSYAAGTYEELDYIVGTGAQYIDTGYSVSDNLTIEIDFELLASQASKIALYGSQVGTSYSTLAYSSTAGTFQFFAGGQGGLTGTAITNGQRHTLSTNASGGTFTRTYDGAAQTASYAGNGLLTSIPIYLLADNNNGTASYIAAAKVYGARLKGGGTVARDYVPRRRVSDGAVGLLDLVNDAFYTSAGTEPFLAPGELPSGYTRLEYIESTGSQYINTQFTPGTENVAASIDFAYTANHDSSALFGAQSSSGVPYCLVPYGAGPYIYAGSSSKIITLSTSLNKRHSLEVKGDSGTVTTTLDGATQTAAYSGSIIPPCPLFVLANNHQGTAKQFTSARVYSCQIYGSGTLVRNYLPAKNSSGEAGLFDLVSMTFFEDAAGVGFVAGPEVAAVAEVAEVSTSALTRTVAASETTGETAYNSFALFSDQLGTIRDYAATRDATGYKNTCIVEYEYEEPASWSGGAPYAAPRHEYELSGTGELIKTVAGYSIPYVTRRGYLTARIEDGLPDDEVYLDLTGTKPPYDDEWSRSEYGPDSLPEFPTDMRASYEAFPDALVSEGLKHLQANFPMVEEIDTGELSSGGYLRRWDLGDRVDALLLDIGIDMEARITGVDEVYEGATRSVTPIIGEKKHRRI